MCRQEFPQETANCCAWRRKRFFYYIFITVPSNSIQDSESNVCVIGSARTGRILLALFAL